MVRQKNSCESFVLCFPMLIFKMKRSKVFALHKKSAEIYGRKCVQYTCASHYNWIIKQKNWREKKINLLKIRVNQILKNNNCVTL